MRARRVALIGLDGSGKSANIDRMKSDGDFSSWHFVWVRWKPMLLDPVYRIMKKREKSAGKTMASSYEEKKGLKRKLFRFPLVRGIWMFFAVLDYLAQFYAKTLKLVLKGENLVFDRYYLDLFVDQGISFSYTPERICREIRRYQRLFPALDGILYIRVRPEVCLARKDDIPGPDYLQKRYAVYERLKNESGWVCIDGEEDFDSVYQHVKNAVLGCGKEPV